MMMMLLDLARDSRPYRPFWIRVDPVDRRRAAIGGSFAEVCAALERLAAHEDALAAQPM